MCLVVVGSVVGRSEPLDIPLGVVSTAMLDVASHFSPTKSLWGEGKEASESLSDSRFLYELLPGGDFALRVISRCTSSHSHISAYDQPMEGGGGWVGPNDIDPRVSGHHMLARDPPLAGCRIGSNTEACMPHVAMWPIHGGMPSQAMRC
jgi:hypothetical protein